MQKFSLRRLRWQRKSFRVQEEMRRHVRLLTLWSLKIINLLDVSRDYKTNEQQNLRWMMNC